jgi:integrase
LQLVPVVGLEPTQEKLHFLEGKQCCFTSVLTFLHLLESSCLLTVAYSVWFGLERMAWIYQRPGSSNWMIGWRHDGKLFQRSTKTADKAEAQRQLDKLDAMFLHQKTGTLTDEVYGILTGKTAAKPTVAQFFDNWLADATRSTTPGTVTKYRQVIREFSGHIQARETGLLLGEVTADHVRSFFNWKSDHSAPGTVAGFRRILRSAFIQAHEEGKINGNPVQSANRKKNRGAALHAETLRKRPFTLKEIKDLFNAAVKPDDKSKVPENGPFWQYMIVVGYHTGMRMGDAITLRRMNVDLAQNIIRFRSRKTDKPQTVPIHPDLRAVFLSMPKGQPNEFYWPEQAQRYEKCGASSFSQEFYTVMATAGLVEPRDEKKKGSGKGRAAKREHATLGFHNLRHTFVSVLKLKGAQDSIAKELVGHRSDAVSAVYTHLPSDMLAVAVAKVPSLISDRRTTGRKRKPVTEPLAVDK